MFEPILFTLQSGMNYVNDGVQRVARYSDSHSTNAAPQPSANAAPFAARPPLRRESMMQNPINNQPGQPQNSLAYQTTSYQQQQTAQQESLPSQSSGFMGSSNYMSHSSQLPGQSNSIPNYQPQDYFHDHPGNAYNQPHIPLYQQ